MSRARDAARRAAHPACEPSDDAPRLAPNAHAGADRARRASRCSRSCSRSPGRTSCTSTTRTSPRASRGGDCDSARDTFLRNDRSLRAFLGFLVIVFPAIIGMFWGAPLVARELETGTFRLAWTQSVTRTRWLAVKLAVVGGISMLVAGLLEHRRHVVGEPVRHGEREPLHPRHLRPARHHRDRLRRVRVRARCRDRCGDPPDRARDGNDLVRVRRHPARDRALGAPELHGTAAQVVPARLQRRRLRPHEQRSDPARPAGAEPARRVDAVDAHRRPRRAVRSHRTSSSRSARTSSTISA